MADHITDIAVSLNTGEETDLQGYTKINVDLNEGAAWLGVGKDIFLWYKKGGSSQPITKLQLSYNASMVEGLSDAGYEKINKNLNYKATIGNDDIYLWFFRGSGEYDTPIVDIQVTASYDQDATKFGNDWERLGCDLNREAGGAWVFVWVKRAQQTYICELTATAKYKADEYLFKAGFIRVDEDTNRGAGGRDIFLWFRQTTDPKRALTDLKVSTTDGENELYRLKGFNRVSQDLNEGAGSNQSVHLWSKRQETGDPIKGIVLLLQKKAVSSYQKAGVTVIEKDLNNKGRPEYICVNQ